MSLADLLYSRLISSALILPLLLPLLLSLPALPIRFSPPLPLHPGYALFIDPSCPRRFVLLVWFVSVYALFSHRSHRSIAPTAPIAPTTMVADNDIRGWVMSAVSGVGLCAAQSLRGRVANFPSLCPRRVRDLRRYRSAETVVPQGLPDRQQQWIPVWFSVPQRRCHGKYRLL